MARSTIPGQLNPNLSFLITSKENFQRGDLLAVNDKLANVLSDEYELLEFVAGLIRESEKVYTSPQEKAKEEQVFQAILNAVSEMYPGSQCYSFGSRFSGLTLSESDMDVFLDCGGMYDGNVNALMGEDSPIVRNVAKLLRQDKAIHITKIVERARVPIVSFYHEITDTFIDLSFKNGLSIQNTLLVKFYLDHDPRVKPMILFLKHWVRVIGLHGPPNFSSYAIVMMVVFYLQQTIPSVLPSVELVQTRHKGPRTTIAGWDCSVNVTPSDFEKSKNPESFASLLRGFFHYYSTFEYFHYAMCPLTGTFVPRFYFTLMGRDSLPYTLKRGLLSLPQPCSHLVDNRYAFCIFDPFDLSHNLTRSITHDMLKVFVYFCRNARDALDKRSNKSS